MRGDGRALYSRALAQGWEGLIAKHAASLYKSGKRSPDWRKLKLVHEQEFVVGGWTEPRQTRSYFGALLLGVYEAPHGSGSRRRDCLCRAHRHRLQRKGADARDEAPEAARDAGVARSRSSPKTNETPHWVRPELVAQIKFTEWTDDGKLRHPVYLGLRDDKKAGDVVMREKLTVLEFAVRRFGVQSLPTNGSTSAKTPNPDAERRTRHFGFSSSSLARAGDGEPARRHPRRCPTATR